MQALSAKPVFAKASVARVARKQTIVCAAQQPEVQTRRASLAILAGLVFGAVVVESAEAASPAPKNASVASMSAYNLEGTKKQGISAVRRKKLLAKARSAAEAASK